MLKFGGHGYCCEKTSRLLFFAFRILLAPLTGQKAWPVPRLLQMPRQGQQGVVGVDHGMSFAK